MSILDGRVNRGNGATRGRQMDTMVARFIDDETDRHYKTV